MPFAMHTDVALPYSVDLLRDDGQGATGPFFRKGQLWTGSLIQLLSVGAAIVRCNDVVVLL